MALFSSRHALNSKLLGTWGLLAFVACAPKQCPEVPADRSRSHHQNAHDRRLGSAGPDGREAQSHKQRSPLVGLQSSFFASSSELSIDGLVLHSLVPLSFPQLVFFG